MSEYLAQCLVEIRVRYAECDAMGFLHHSRYLEYMEVARTDLLRETGHIYRDLEAEGVFFVVTKLNLQYKHPIRYDDVVSVMAGVKKIGKARIDHGYEFRVGRTLNAVGDTTLACVGNDGKPRAMPERIWPGAQV
jgi:acyl-CoA thioester hydrolase